MRRQLLSATALTTSIVFLVPGTALAQPGVVDWSGPYVGIGGGVAYANTTINFDYSEGGGPASVYIPELGLAGTISGGLNLQNGNFVFGLQADGTLTTLKGNASGPDFDVDDRLHALLSLRGRLGIAAGPLLFHTSLGIAAGVASIDALVADGDDPSAATRTGFGYGPTAGAGVEIALNDNISLNTEGIVTMLSGPTASGDNGKGPFTAERKSMTYTIQSGVNIHF